MAAQPAGRTRDELDETFEILDRDGAVVVFGGDLMERGFGIVSAKATEDTRLSSSAKGVYAYFCAHAGARPVRAFRPEPPSQPLARRVDDVNRPHAASELPDRSYP